jgi:hypothetical protein
MKITLRDVKEIKETVDIDEVNQRLTNGWVLIDTYKPDPYTLVFVMGLVIRS